MTIKRFALVVLAGHVLAQSSMDSMGSSATTLTDISPTSEASSIVQSLSSWTDGSSPSMTAVESSYPTSIPTELMSMSSWTGEHTSETASMAMSSHAMSDMSSMATDTGMTTDMSTATSGVMPNATDDGQPVTGAGIVNRASVGLLAISMALIASLQL
ncbi:hypothetical protein M426DRAFT_258291 [Hypoxylon sp. CI-4A]|nr:hypothetical protein M426DRAFT_258291 [Hypoxylon sp. CI-4A]